MRSPTALTLLLLALLALAPAQAAYTFNQYKEEM